MLLRFVQIVDHCGHGVRHKVIFLVAEGIAPGWAELIGHCGFHHAVFEAGILAQFDQGAGVLLDIGSHVLEIEHGRADQNFAGHVAAQFGNDRAADLFGVQLGGIGFTGRDIRKADARFPAAAGALGIDAAKVVVFILRQHAAFDDGAGRDHADDIALDKAFGQGGVLHLLTDCDLVALSDQAGHVSFVGVERHTAHGGALFLAAAFACQRQLQLARGR